MTLLHTITLNDQDVLIYDEIDPDQAPKGRICSTSPFTSDVTYCYGVKCEECSFYKYSGVSCTKSLPEFIRSSLLPTHPELLV